MGDQYKPLNSLLDQAPLILEALGASVNGIIIIDHQEPNDPIIYCNKAFEELTGYNKEDILGRNCRFLQGEETSQEGRYVIKDALIHNKACIVELLNYRKDGSEFWNEVYISPIINNEGKATHFIGVQNNISERKLKEINAELAVAYSEKLKKQKEEFISVASHELKTPITSLKASLQLLQKGKGNPATATTENLIEQANKSINKVSHLIDDLLNSNTMNEGQIALRPSHFILAEMIEACCDPVRAAGKYKIRLEGDKSLAVKADADRINQVIDNMVNNAIKYAPESKEIKIEISKENEFARIAVIDKGKGIAPENQAKLFDRYYQAEPDKMHNSGLGLGLYISTQIIKRHHGNIGVKSKPGSGSTFWFTLPLAG